jgi:taurine--2-oxoglutarate transaminase
VSHFVIAPPLIVEKEEIERGIGMLDKWLHLADELAD